MVKSFLNNRKKRVIVNGKIFSFIPVISRVSQGGVLSGILVSLYINDLPDEMEFSSRLRYVDDAKISLPIIDQSSVKNLQSDIKNISMWCNKWQLNVNINKFFFIHLSNKKKNHAIVQYTMKNTSLKRPRNLGKRRLKTSLTYRQSSITNSELTVFEGALKRDLLASSAVHIKPTFDLILSIVWNHVHDIDIDKIEKIQNKFTRLLNFSSFRTPEKRNRIIRIISH